MTRRSGVGHIRFRPAVLDLDMWTPETKLRDDGEELMRRLAAECCDGSESWEARTALTAILGWGSIAAGLLKIPASIVQAVCCAGVRGKVPVPALSSGIARLAKDLEHSSTNSVHVLYAMLHVSPDECGQFLRECDRILRESRGSLSTEDLAFIQRLEGEGQGEEAARFKNVVGRNVVSPPFVELALGRYLTSVWYPYDRKRFENFRLLAERKLTVDDRQGDVMLAFGLTLRHERRTPGGPPSPDGNVRQDRP